MKNKYLIKFVYSSNAYTITTYDDRETRDLVFYKIMRKNWNKLWINFNTIINLKNVLFCERIDEVDNKT